FRDRRPLGYRAFSEEQGVRIARYGKPAGQRYYAWWRHRHSQYGINVGGPEVCSRPRLSRGAENEASGLGARPSLQLCPSDLDANVRYLRTLREAAVSKLVQAIGIGGEGVREASEGGFHPWIDAA